MTKDNHDKNAGKKPIVVKKMSLGSLRTNEPGREAASIIGYGAADHKDMDDADKYSFGMRLGATCPIEQIDSIGVDLCYNIFSCVYKYPESSSVPSPILEQKLTRQELGFKTGDKGIQNWTDEEMTQYNERIACDLIKVGKVSDCF